MTILVTRIDMAVKKIGQLGRAIRYTEEAVLRWMKSCTRTSTSQS
jgi:hypothetical protein